MEALFSGLIQMRPRGLLVLGELIGEQSERRGGGSGS